LEGKSTIITTITIITIITIITTITTIANPPPATIHVMSLFSISSCRF
jgi:hypothetical protein